MPYKERVFKCKFCFKEVVKRAAADYEYICNDCSGYKKSDNINKNKKERICSCAICGKDFISKQANAIYCPEGHYMKCAVCDKEFHYFGHIKRHTCSRECSIEYNKRKVQETIQEKICPLCNEAFMPVTYSQKVCKNIHYKDCEICGKQIPFTGPSGPKYCSKECRDKGIVNSVSKHGLENYGVRWHSQSKQVRDKMKETCLKIYGVEYAIQAESVKEKIRETNIKNCGRPHLDQVHILNYDEWLNFNEWLNKNENKYNLLEISEYFNVSVGAIKHKLKDETDRRKIKDYYNLGIEEQIVKRKLIDKGVSEEDLIFHSRSLIKPKEIDIFIKSLNLGIEVNPLWTHNIKVTDKNYHKDKAKRAYDNNIRLLMVYNLVEDEVDNLIEKALDDSYVLTKEVEYIQGDKLGLYSNLFQDYYIADWSEPRVISLDYNFKDRKSDEYFIDNIEDKEKIIEEEYAKKRLCYYDAGLVTLVRKGEIINEEE